MVSYPIWEVQVSLSFALVHAHPSPTVPAFDPAEEGSADRPVRTVKAGTMSDAGEYSDDLRDVFSLLYDGDDWAFESDTEETGADKAGDKRQERSDKEVDETTAAANDTNGTAREDTVDKVEEAVASPSAGTRERYTRVRTPSDQSCDALGTLICGARGIHAGMPKVGNTKLTCRNAFTINSIPSSTPPPRPNVPGSSHPAHPLPPYTTPPPYLSLLSPLYRSTPHSHHSPSWPVCGHSTRTPSPPPSRPLSHRAMSLNSAGRPVRQSMLFIVPSAVPIGI